MVLYDMTAQEKEGLVCKIKNKKSRDVYGFTVAFLKGVVSFISAPLCVIINKCYTYIQGVFPNKLKIANVLPIFRTGDLNNS